ncbi:retrovirus-related pol polyprotein from transposon TNT 1-94 [Tanacetum coccineum]
MRVASVNEKKYILVIVDDYSRFTWVKFLRSNDEAPYFIIKFLKMIQVRLQVTIRRIKTDNGTEFVNQTLRKYYEKIAARTMLIYAKAPLFLWAEAVATACYTQNCSIIRLRHDKTPYEILHDKPPDLSFFHVFGALCYPTNDSENLGKLQLKADIDFDELTAMASEHNSLGPALHEMTHATISSGLVPNPSPSTPVDHPTPEVIAPIAEVVAPVPAVSTSLPSSTTVDQDEPSPIMDLIGSKRDRLITVSCLRERDRLIVVMFCVRIERELIGFKGELYENTEDREILFLYYYAFSVSLLLTPLCCDDIHDVKPRVSALAGVKEKMTLKEFDGQTVEEIETKIISKDGTITRVPGKFQGYETSEEEPFAPHRLPQPKGNMNGWLIEDEEEVERNEVDLDLESTASSKPLWKKTTKSDHDCACRNCPYCSK